MAEQNSSNSTLTTQQNLNLPFSNAIEINNQRYVPGQKLTERQRLELYELRTAALREIEENEMKGKEADPYLKKYLKSIDDLLKKALVA